MEEKQIKKEINIKETIVKLEWDVMLIMLCLGLGLVNRLSYMFLAFSAVLCFPFFKDFIELKKAQPEEKQGITVICMIGIGILVLGGLGVLAGLIFAKLKVLLYIEIAIVLCGFLPSVGLILADYIKRKKQKKEEEILLDKKIKNDENDVDIKEDTTKNKIINEEDKKEEISNNEAKKELNAKENKTENNETKNEEKKN